jgi:hypothetical protein
MAGSTNLFFMKFNLLKYKSYKFLILVFFRMPGIFRLLSLPARQAFHLGLQNSPLGLSTRVLRQLQSMGKAIGPENGSRNARLQKP